MKLFNKLSKLIIAPIIVLSILMSNHTFFEDGIDSSKLLVNPASAEVSPDVFGYNPTFDQELDKIRQISPQEFAKRYDAKVKYLKKISWNPTKAKFWNLFNLAQKKHNQKTNRGNYSHYNFRLNSDELAVFKKQGFVVSERMGRKSFAQLFYQIYSSDLPVFVSADALLHAWHRSYDAMLEELEESYLATSLDEILTGMADKIPEASNQYGDGVLDLSLIDADYFLAVARSLLAGETVKTKLNQDARVAATLKAIEGEQLQQFELFGRKREMDFSQFKVRGHYENSETLKKYFQAVMWCGRVDLRIAGKPEEASSRELGAAIILNDLLKQSGKFEQWQQFDQMLQTFVGPTDSMTFAQLADLLKQAKIKSPTDIKDLSTLEQLQTKISANNLGFQNIRSHVYFSPEDDDQIKDIIPYSFTVIGQKFILDSWMLSKVVYDDIIWNGEKVQRRVPSGLDVAFATLGNTQVVPELVDRITNQNGHEFRDGLNYQHNLAAAFNVVEKLNPSAWEENLYMNWLATLRELSKPTTDSKYPEAMRTRAWGMKTLNTQLASWTQLRHDTILYAKQSYTGGTLCYYPAGFVEPRPEFWERFEKMAVLAGQLIENTPFPERFRKIQQKQTKFFKNFSQQLTILKEIALKELAQQELTEAQSNFLEKVVEIQRFASGGPTYSGWYPSLFYKKPEDSDKWDAIVADVHTDVPEPMVGDPGSVLHQGVGNIDLLMIAVDNGKDKMVFAGPVLSHYEFEMPEVSRKSDSEWKKDIQTGKLPPRPNWTKSYLVVD
ncbi:DUF3160 domain-containing protein [Moorena bouillonii]|uniref:DUF3160 domain-containing protein n=1 Tax=Moorena bouillonii PNG TaxID=568701 RepID=A0A1U7N120_9CYAN|nr:DUF3160 domain-containing protein [Moorena bouillonii]OLT59632.1 hypothetical protein BJP37_11935 [Moorena bouillonii PNG]